MSTIKSAAEKKRLSYERDHYNRGGENDKAWRKAKPLKKAKARRAFRKASKDLLKSTAADETDTSNAARKQASIRQRRVEDWGAVPLRKFVASRLEQREQRIGTKKQRKKA